MDFNSQICTTKEQSERLLSLGLKKETADMHHYQYVEGGRWNIEAHPSIAGYTNRLIPAWSLHRLIELSGMGIIDTTIDNIYDKIIQYIEFLIKCGDFNKEYLEE
jgi:hypothetical protein